MLSLSSQRTRGRMRAWQSTGDAGISFSPVSISGLQVWLKASAIVAADGDAIANWAGYAGTAYSATQSTTANQPIYKTGVFPTGAPAVRFDGVNDFLTLGNIGSAFTSEATVFVVAQTNDSVYSLYETSSTGDGYWRYNGTTTYMAAFRTARLNSFAWTLPATGSHLFTLSSSASVYSLWIDGGTAQTASASFSGGNTHYIGVNPVNTFANLAGDIGEVIVYNRVLTNTERTAVESYLKAVFGL